MSEPAAPPQAAIDAAIKVAKGSKCAKSQRGAVVYSTAATLQFQIFGRGANEPSGACDGSEACRAKCSVFCEHAEFIALRDAVAARHLPYTHADLDLVHVKVVDGNLVAGGPPSCLPCAQAIITSEVWAVWLYEDMWEGPRWTRRLAPQFYRSTLRRQLGHEEYEPRNGIEMSCAGCGMQAGAKRDQRGFWRCTNKISVHASLMKGMLSPIACNKLILRAGQTCGYPAP